MPEEKKQSVKKNPTAHKRYELKGESISRKNKSCPKCGPGYFLAQHKDRITCGNCHYTEFSRKK